MNLNMKSLGKGIGIVVIFSVGWLILAPLMFGLKDPVSLAVGILVIVSIVGIAGYFTVPIQHKGVRKVLGKREMDENKQFEEGAGWNAPWQSIEVVSAKEKDIDVPIIIVLSKDNVEMEIDVWAWWKVSDAVLFLNLENPEKTATTAVISKCTEEGIRFVRAHTCNQALGAEKELQQQIKASIAEEVSQYGIKVTNIDVKSILPTQKIRNELAEDKGKDIKTRRFVKTLKKIKKEASGVTDDTLVNTAQVIEGTVKKEIKEEKKTFKLDVEKNVTDLISSLVPKKKDKPEKDTRKGDEK